MSRRKGNPWLRFDVQTYADAKVRLGRCGAVWPWCLATLKRCGGSATNEDLDPMLIAADLCISPEMAQEQLAGAKRVGLLIQDGDEWVTANWHEYQPDPRARWDKRKAEQSSPESTRGNPDRPRDTTTSPRELVVGPKASRFDTAYGTGRDETGLDPPLPPKGGEAGDASPSAGPDIEAQAETVQAVVGRLDSDEHAGKAEAGQRLLAAIQARGGVMRRKTQGDFAALVGSEPTAVVRELARMVGEQTQPITSPLGYVRRLLDDARAKVEAARAEQRRAERLRLADEQRARQRAADEARLAAMTPMQKAERAFKASLLSRASEPGFDMDAEVEAWRARWRAENGGGE